MFQLINRLIFESINFEFKLKVDKLKNVKIMHFDFYIELFLIFLDVEQHKLNRLRS